MDCTRGLVDKFRDLVLDLIWEQCLYLVCYGQNIEQLNERLSELTHARISIQYRIDEATNNAEQIEEKVLSCLIKVDEMSEQVEQLLKEGRAIRECSLTSCPNPWLRYKLSKRAKAMARQTADICGEAYFGRVSYLVPPQSMPKLTNEKSNEGINSRVPIMNQIMEALGNSSVKMIGLCGLGGVGKTTIAKEIAKNEKMFEKAIMVTVSNELNIENIQGQIAEKLGMQLNEKFEEARAERLCERLKKEKNMLLILDDLWVELDLRKVGIPFLDVENNSKKNEGCKILLTSRNKKLLSDLMKCQQIIEVSILLEDEAWELFKRIAELSVDSSSPELISIATDIVRKCGGLPLFIATLAKALRNKHLNEWKNALAGLNYPLQRNITGFKEADPILKLSYDHLSSSENKHIFLLASMLSHDPSIEDLLMYSMGLDFLEHTENIEDAYVGLSAIVSKLKSLNLFLDSFSRHHVTMHDVIRDVALSIASKELPAFIVRHRPLNEWPDEKKLEDFKGICLQESDISVDLPEELHGPKLKFFLLNSTKRDLTIPKMFFKSSMELKMLAFTKVHFSSLPLLGYLKKLKTFCLHSCLLEDITEIRTLKNLKVLSLAYSEIQWLPFELAELTFLQMLNLSHCSNLKVIPGKLLSSFKKLEVLYMENSFDQWKVEGSNGANGNAGLDELNDLPISCLDIHIPNASMLPENLFLDMNLKRYRILIGEHWGWQDNYETSKILKLDMESSFHLKYGVQKLLEGVEGLSFCGRNGLENVLPSHGGRRFLHLRHLHIDSDDIKFIVSNRGHHEATTSNVSNIILESLFNKVLFPSLEILELSNFNHLIRLWDDQLLHNSWSNLKTLIVKSCGLVKLMHFHVLKSLINLEELEVSECDMLEKVFDFGELNDSNEMVSSSVVVPLKKLKLSKLPKLKSLSLAPSLVPSSNLTHLEVAWCHGLTTLITSPVVQSLVHLTHISIHCCDKIEEIVTKQNGEDDQDKKIFFNKLECLKLDDLPRLKRFSGYKYALMFPSLHQLIIANCPRFRLFSPGIIHTPSLESVQPLQDNQQFWDTNLNKTIYQQRFVASTELVLNENDVSMIRTDQFPEDHCGQVEILRIERFVDERITFPYALLEKFLQLNALFVEDSSFDEIFPSYVEVVDCTGKIPPFSRVYLANLDELKNIWRDDSQLSLMQNLEILHVENCSNLIKLAPSSASFDNLMELKVSKCHQLVYLVTDSTAKSLVSLETLEINDCQKLEEIVAKETNELAPSSASFDNLREMKVSKCHQLVYLVADSTAKSLVSLETLEINDCQKLEEIVAKETNELVPSSASFDNLMELKVSKCHQLVYLVTDSTAKSLVSLETLEINDCEKLEEIVAKETNELAPSSASFDNLRELKVSKCHQLVYIVADSTSKSLASLETLEINDCEKLEEIVAKETNEDAERRITFNGLKILKLTDLPSLKPGEDKRDFDIEDRTTNGGCRNIFISLFCHKKGLLPKLEILELCNLNNLIPLIWDDQLSRKSFSNLKTLMVERCGLVQLVPLHVLKSLTSLEELEVKDCKMLEMVFDFEDLNYYKEAVSSTAVVSLKKLTLWNLPKLKNVWHNHHQGNVSFPSLRSIDVSFCGSLKSIFPASMAKGMLRNLEKLRVDQCCIDVIVGKDQVSESDAAAFDFPMLTLLELSGLPNLKNFF